MAKWTREKIEHLLRTNPIFVERSIIQLFYRQTEVEQATNDAKKTNGKGFNKPDSRRMTIYAKSILKRRKERKEGTRLDDWQYKDAKDRILKYAKQLADIANNQPK